MQEGCAVCGLHYEREPGYFVGAIYVNYAVTAALALGSVLVVDVVLGLTLAQELALSVVLAVFVPLGFFRHARSLWIAADLLLTGTDERRARRGRGRR